MKLPENRVKGPGAGQWFDFTQLSSSGGIINAYNALLMAETVKGEHENVEKR
jgi:hypothetical protein